jgi:hypothetical protein
VDCRGFTPETLPDGAWSAAAVVTAVVLLRLSVGRAYSQAVSVVVSALCADSFEPQARRYTTLFGCELCRQIYFWKEEAFFCTVFGLLIYGCKTSQVG